jgi:2-polyprenyl-3-methyl-5-hydroxy-6-metoxy-1,4-benzoquinol methylase
MTISLDLIQQRWQEKAAFWDALMGAEGNLFHRTLVSPTVEKLLNPCPGMTVLDVACGNGTFARRLAQLGAQVHAVDFSANLIIHAQGYPSAGISYQVADATDEAALLALGIGHYEAVVCNMALMDMPVIEPFFRAARHLIQPQGVLIISVTHPSFNQPSTVLGLEKTDDQGSLVETYSIKVSQYLEVEAQAGVGAPGEPTPHFYFHRPLAALLAPAFQAGWVVDGLEEAAFPAGLTSYSALSWVHFQQIPPLLAVRLRPAAQ